MASGKQSIQLITDGFHNTRGDLIKLLFFDTESSDLAASWGRLLCGSFCTENGEAYTFRGDKKPWIGQTKIDDSKLAIAIRDELESVDIIGSWNGLLHDVPLLNARLSLAGERPCKLSEKHGTRHVDLMYYMAGQSMKVGGKRLELAATFFNCQNRKTSLEGSTWQLAAVGDRKAMDAVVDHCEADVRVLRELFPHLAPYVKKLQFDLSEVWQFLDLIPSRR